MTSISHLFRSKALGYLLVSALLLITSAGLYLSSISANHTIFMGKQDTMWIRGFDAVDTSENQLFRWSSDTSTIYLPHIHQGWNTITLYGWGSPSSARINYTGTDVTMTVDSQAPVSFIVQAGFRRQYTLLVAAQTLPTWSTPVTFKSTVVSESETSRLLGFALINSTFRATSLHAGIPYGLGLFWVVSAIFVIMLRLLGQSWHLSTLLGVCAPLIMAIVFMSNSVAMLPHLHWFAIWLVLVCLALLVARNVDIIQSTSIRGWLLPLFCAMAIWLVPMYQYILWIDGINIRNFRFESWIIFLLAAIFIGSRVLKVDEKWLQDNAIVPPIAQFNYWYMFIGFAVIGIIYQEYAWSNLFAYELTNLSVWLDTARSWFQSGQVYSALPINDVTISTVQSPFFILLFTPFVDYNNFMIIHGYRIVNIALLGLTFILWLRIVGTHTYQWWIVVFVIMMNYQPLIDTLSGSHSGIVLLTGFTLVLYLAQHQRFMFAGAITALLTLFNIYAALILLFFVIKRQWPIITGFAVGLVVCNAISMAFMGWDVHVQYVYLVASSMFDTTAWIENQSIAGFVARWYADPFTQSIFTIPTVTLLAQILAILFIIPVGLMTLHNTIVTSREYAIQYGLWIVAMMLVFPTMLMHYSATLFIVFLIMFWYYHDKTIGLVRAAIFAFSYALIAFGDYQSFNYPTDIGIVGIMLSSYKFYGFLLLLSVMVSEVLRNTTEWSPAWSNEWQMIQRWLKRDKTKTVTPVRPLPTTPRVE